MFKIRHFQYVHNFNIKVIWWTFIFCIIYINCTSRIRKASELLSIDMHIFYVLSFVDEKISLSPLAQGFNISQCADGSIFTIYHRENRHNFFSLDKENIKSHSRIFFLHWLIFFGEINFPPQVTRNHVVWLWHCNIIYVYFL